MTGRYSGPLLVVLGILILCGGCAPWIEVKKKDPDSIPLAGVKTLALGDISGSAGPALARNIAFALSMRRGIALTDPFRAEVILSGRVECELVDTRGADLVEIRRETGRKKKVTKSDPFVGRRFTIKAPVSEKVVTESDFVWRRGRMTLVYSLTDGQGRSLEASADAGFSEKYGGVNEYSHHGRRLKDLPSKNKTINLMVRELAEKVAARLAPSPKTFSLVLDVGPGPLGQAEIRRGVKLAEAGHWNQAVEVWEQVLEDDPEHPSAYYNLGAAYERRGGSDNLHKALDMYAKAARNGDNPLYREALTRVTVTIRGLKKVRPK